MTEAYFYTEYFTGEWSSGPVMHRRDPERGLNPIESLERAQELAEERHNPHHFRRPCKTTYGVEYPSADVG